MYKPTSCFVHVPKCGGSALTRHLQTALGGSRVFHVGETRYSAGPVTPLLSRYPVVTGHFTLAQIPEAVFATTFLFTFLREPADRILSLYHFLRESEETNVPEVAQAKLRDLAAILEDESNVGRLTTWANWQTFLFSGAADQEHTAKELLPAALHNLERFDFVGIYEAYREGVQRLGRMRGWPFSPVVPPFKVTRQRPRVAEADPATVVRILEVNACDAQLYARARELWERTKTAPVILPAVELEAVSANRAVATPAVERFQPAERGSREITITGIGIRDGILHTPGTVEQGNPVEIEIRLRSGIDAADITVGVRISDELGAEIYGVNTQMLGRPLAFTAGQDVLLRYTCDTPIAAGGYYLTIAAHSGEGHLYKTYHWMDYAAAFHCTRSGPAAFAGLVDLKATLTVESPLPTIETPSEDRG